MAPRAYDANNEFGLEVLCVIATDPAFAPLAKNLILKGGAALLHGHRSGRATLRDLDFGLWASVEFGRREVDQILVRLDKWQPRSEAPRDDHRGGVTILITFVHPSSRQAGSIELQVSRRRQTIPPRLKEKVEPKRLTASGKQFDFLFMPLEEIVAEKAIRCFNPTKGPREEDLYDIGFAQGLGLDSDDTSFVFGQLRRAEGQRFPFPAQGQKIDNIVADLDAPGAVARLERSQLYEPYATFALIKQRVTQGAILVKQLGNIKP